MLTIKSYTDIEQSKKLAEFLSLDSADMVYIDVGYSSRLLPKDDIDANTYPVIVSCWSLMALLSVIPKCIGDYNIFRIDINDIDTSIWYDKIGYGVCNELPDITMKEPVDACVEMIEKLHEQNLI